MPWESCSREPKKWITPAGTRIDAAIAASGNVRRSFSAFDQLDAIAIGITHEAKSRAALAHAVRRLLWLDSLLGQLRKNVVEVGDRNRNVVVARAELIGVHAVVVGELEPRAVVGEAHEDVDRLVADREAPDLLHPERLVEGDRAVDVADAITGVDQLAHS